jgi:pimeloyl-ACP methyl ester carboxylesterase
VKKQKGGKIMKIKINIILFLFLIFIGCIKNVVINKPIAKGTIMKTKTIVFIHGMFMNHECWNDWVIYYQNKGYKCIAPDWPFHDKPVEQLRKEHPNVELGKLTLDSLVSYYERIIKTLDEPPIIIGHSMGGLIVQILINRGYGACGIAIDSAPPKGVFSFKWSFLKSNFPTINPFKGNAPYLMPFERFQYAFVNALPLNEQQGAYNKFVVPESRNVARSSTGNAGKVDFNKPHQPLLLIAGSEDNIIPASLNKSNFEKYKDSSSVTDFKEFEGRTHFIIGQNNWQEVADYIYTWIEKGQ